MPIPEKLWSAGDPPRDPVAAPTTEEPPPRPAPPPRSASRARLWPMLAALSDGARTAGADPVAAAQAAGKARVPVYTVSLGTPDGIVETPRGALSVPPDSEAMAAVANASGGRSFSADDGDELSAVYERLGSQIGTKDEKREITVAFTAAGVALLGLALVSSSRRFARLP